MAKCFPVGDLPETLFRSDASRMDSGLVEGLDRYFNERIRPGGFLLAVLRNDLAEACYRAHPLTAPRLVKLVKLLRDHAPANAWGSPEAVEAWLRPSRLNEGGFDD